MAKWIIADVDGCISPEESVAWDLELFGRFARLCRDASAGRGALPPLTLCTGRPQPYVEALMKILDVRAPAICENGAVFYTIHDNRSRYGPGVTTEKIRGLRQVRAFVESQILPRHPEALIQFGKEAQISIYSQRPAIFPEIRRQIEQFVRDNGGMQLRITASHYYLNISLAGVDKGEALAELLVELNCAPADAIGIGDTEGDMPLRQRVGYFACPANATDQIKSVADYVSPLANLAGVLDILQRLGAAAADPNRSA